MPLHDQGLSFIKNNNKEALAVIKFKKNMVYLCCCLLQFTSIAWGSDASRFNDEGDSLERTDSISPQQPAKSDKKCEARFGGKHSAFTPWCEVVEARAAEKKRKRSEEALTSVAKKPRTTDPSTSDGAGA